jgi:Tfp pilus assembly pilus retraction ATPase PilT
MLRCVISQRLLPRQSDGGRVAEFEIVKNPQIEGHEKPAGASKPPRNQRAHR